MNSFLRAAAFRADMEREAERESRTVETVRTIEGPPPARPKRSGPGRPPKLTPEVRVRIWAAFQAGATLTAACKAEGVSPNTWRWSNWVHRKGLTQPSNACNPVAPASGVRQEEA